MKQVIDRLIKSKIESTCVPYLEAKIFTVRTVFIVVNSATFPILDAILRLINDRISTVGYTVLLSHREF